MKFDPDITPNIPSHPREEQILFLYASPDGGHKECAAAVRKAFKHFHPPTIQTIGLDVITYLSPILGPIIAKAYLEILRRTPQIWNFLYDNPDIEEITRELRQLFNFFNASKLKFLLKEYRPTAFVCTHAIPCGVIAEQKKRGNCQLPLAAIVTDYAVHSYWISPEIDLYIVANQDSQKTLIARGVAKEKVRVCGIPTDPAFNKKMNLSEARKKLGLDPNKTVLLMMGGTHGLGPIAEMAKEILSIRPALQLLVVTGKNNDLDKELLPFRKYKNLQVYGYTRLVPLLMDAADLLITKPGGLSSSEALVKKLPMILVNPIPGQEERNAHYLVKNGAAIQIKKIKELKESIQRLIQPRKRLSSIAANCQKIATPQAAGETAKEIILLLHRLREKSEAEKISQARSQSPMEVGREINQVLS